MNGVETRPLMEDMNTTRPREVLSIGSTACVTATWLTRLTSNCRRSSSMARPSTGPLTTTPAFVDHRVKALTDGARQLSDLVRIRDVQQHRRDPSLRLTEGLPILRPAHPGVDLPAALCHVQRNGAADPATGASDQNRRHCRRA
jgi:hypothetical protein